MIGLVGGNGPISFEGNSTKLVRNPYSWTGLGHVLYVDQPVGSGFSVASNPYPVQSQDRVTEDFVRWLKSFMKHFPHLQSKKIHFMGESWAGIYIPYFTNALLEDHSLKLDIRSISLGDGSWGNAAAMSAVATGAYMHAHSSRLGLPKNVLSAFAAADHTCGFDTVLQEAATFPPQGKIHIPGNPERMNYRRLRRDLVTALDPSCNIEPTTPAAVQTSVFNSTCYGPCATFSTALDYIDTASQNGTGVPCFDVYDISHDCSTIDPYTLMADYFSREDVQKALHVPNTGEYSACNSTILNTLLAGPTVEPPAYNLLPSLVTKHNISLHIYNGALDMLINHIGTELSIQNMTWRGAQGFSKKPTRLFYVDDAAPDLERHSLSTSSTARPVAGTWASERGVSYHLFYGAGHSVFASKRREMFAYVQDVVVGEKA